MSQDQEGAAGFEGVVLASSLVTYQPGAVVSRTLVRKPAGTVTAFAFDALVLSLEGEADFSVSGTSSRVSAGQLLKLPAHQPHAIKATTRFKMLLIMIRA